MSMYTKILVARESTKNRCNGPEGAWLVPASNADRPGFRLPNDEHYFVSLEGRIGNLFGWVEELDREITPEELQDNDRSSLKKSFPGIPAEVPGLDSYVKYLKAVQRFATGTPMACDIREVKLPGSQKSEINVHKVIFHKK